MATLTKFFFRAPYSLPRPSEIFRWWEARRPVYNLAVGVAGLATLSVISIAQLFFTDRLVGIPLEGVVLYAILANVIFSLGPIVDTIIMRLWGRDYSEVGPTLFRYGFVFAVGLTLLPIPVTALRLLLGTIFG